MPHTLYGVTPSFPFGRNVKAARQRLGYTYHQLAEMIGEQIHQISHTRGSRPITHSYLHKIEAGKATPPIVVALAIAKALGMTLDELVKP